MMTSFCGTIVRGAELQNRIDVLVIQHAETGGIEVEVEYTVSFKEVEGMWLSGSPQGWMGAYQCGDNCGAHWKEGATSC